MLAAEGYRAVEPHEFAYRRFPGDRPWRQDSTDAQNPDAPTEPSGWPALGERRDGTAQCSVSPDRFATESRRLDSRRREYPSSRTGAVEPFDAPSRSLPCTAPSPVVCGFYRIAHSFGRPTPVAFPMWRSGQPRQRRQRIRARPRSWVVIASSPSVGTFLRA